MVSTLLDTCLALSVCLSIYLPVEVLRKGGFKTGMTGEEVLVVVVGVKEVLGKNY